MVNWSHCKHKGRQDEEANQPKADQAGFWVHYAVLTSLMLTFMVPLLSLSRVLKAPESEQTCNPFSSSPSDENWNHLLEGKTHGTWHPASQGSQCSCQNPCSHFRRCIFEWSSGRAGRWEETLQRRPASFSRFRCHREFFGFTAELQMNSNCAL